jgi:hypothetical protein
LAALVLRFWVSQCRFCTARGADTAAFDDGGCSAVGTDRDHPEAAGICEASRQFGAAKAMEHRSGWALTAATTPKP